MPLDLERVRSQLPDRRIDGYATLPSTMLEASRLAAADCRSGTMVVAEEQTAGVGRYGRAWHSETEAGLYVSIVLRSSLPVTSLPVLTLALGLAAGEAILKATDLVCDLRWPNDVLLHSKKCAGILTQLEGSAIIAGIGINVNHSSFPEELRGIATSLRLASERVYSRERLLVELASSVDNFCGLLEDRGSGAILTMFTQASSFVRGRRVSVDQGDSTLHGTTEGLNHAGFLIVRGDDGRENVILAGGVRPCS